MSQFWPKPNTVTLNRRRVRLALLRALGRLYAAAPGDQPLPERPRILLIRPDHLGDVLFATPALRLLREALPEARLTCLVGPWAREVMEHNPHVDEVVTLQFPGFTRRAKGWIGGPYLQAWRAAARLRPARHDLAIVLRFDHWWGALLAMLARVPRRAGYSVPELLPFLTHAVAYQPGRHEVRQNASLVRAALDLPTSLEPGNLEFVLGADDRDFAARWVRSFANERPLVALQPGSGAPVKLWRPEAFARVGDWLHQRGLAVVLTGSAAERPLLLETAGQMAQAPPLLTHANLGQLAAVLQRCALAIGCDNGTMHLAVSQDVPTVHLFGPVDHRTFGPWGDPARHRVLLSGLACIPCNRLDYRSEELPDHPCVRLIDEEAVIAAAESLLQRGTALRVQA